MAYFMAGFSLRPPSGRGRGRHVPIFICNPHTHSGNGEKFVVEWGKKREEE